MTFSDLLHKARPEVKKYITRLEAPYPAYTIFISVSNGKTRASVCHVTGMDFDKLWQEAVTTSRDIVRRKRLEVKYLRIDWVSDAKRLNWRLLRSSLRSFKRNYFRFGLAFNQDFRFALLEQELNANAMLYGGTGIQHSVVNEKNFTRYTEQRMQGFQPDFSDDAEVFMLRTQGVFVADKSGPKLLHATGNDAGRRIVGKLNQKKVFDLIASGSRFLTKQVKATGRFYYGWHPCFDRQINAYNSLRHASTTYSMLEAWEVTRCDDLLQAIERSLSYLTGHLIKEVSLPDGTEAAFLVDQGGEIKLGGNAVCLLALVKYSELFARQRYLNLLEKLALGIEYMQHSESGAFVHVLNYPDLSVKEKFRIIYYDGEAAFGLMRLYGITQNQRWLTMVERAFDYFIAQKHWKAHDHWLSYCANELTRYRPEERYFRFALDNVKDYLGFVLQRITTFPTLLELMMAAEELVRRLQVDDEHRHLLTELDIEKFYRALEFRAQYLMNGHFWPELAMYFKCPDKIVGSFFIRHHAFRIRIDDVEHYLSGFVAYHRYLRAKENSVELPQSAQNVRSASQQKSCGEPFRIMSLMPGLSVS